MKITSKIKSIFSDETLRLLAAVCDTRRIESDRQKMQTVISILGESGVKFVILGGATNRIAIQAGGYAIKIAINHQGFKDNFQEYAMSQETYPKTSKTYETTGYMLVAELVRLMDIDTWKARKSDILKILDSLAEDYLIGDVGYLEKNITNWGIRDNGDLVILDYAYCHRGTENLFMCEKCGEGILQYDINYDYFICSNRTVCNARYTYNDRKRINGDQVDLDMIEERKEASIIMPPGVMSKEVTTLADQYVDDNTVVVHNDYEYYKAQEENNMISVNYDSEEMMERMLEIARVALDNPDEAKRMNERLNAEITQSVAEDQKKVVISDDYEASSDDVWHLGRKYSLTKDAYSPDPGLYEAVDPNAIEDDDDTYCDILERARAVALNQMDEIDDEPSDEEESVEEPDDCNQPDSAPEKKVEPERKATILINGKEYQG